jgi:hypothetical protein
VLKVAAVHALPFHRWILADTVDALRALGVEVEEFSHVPTHAHDWASGNTAILRRLGKARPDALLLADYPYAPFREAAGGCPVFATRHSLAARGNTWAPEQTTADYLACFGPWDRQILGVSGWDGKYLDRLLDTGCPWAGPLLTAGPLAGPGFRKRPVVAWCPTWNDWSPDIADELATLQPEVQIVYRPHYATAWRNPEALVRAAALGFTIDDPLQHPADLLLQADVLVGDVSGIVLLALAAPGARLPIVQVDPPAGTAGVQIEKWGPEWTLRSRIGPTIRPERVAGYARSAIAHGGEDPWRGSRESVRAHLFGADPLPGGLTPGQRLAKEIACRL